MHTNTRSTIASITAIGRTTLHTIRTMAWLCNGKWVVAGGEDDVVRLWNVSDGMKDGGMSNLERKQRESRDRMPIMHIRSRFRLHSA